MSSRPVIVLVQGAFQTPEFYHTFEQALKSKGFDVVHPVLPTCSDTDAVNFGERGPADDKNVIQSTVAELVENGKTIFIASHSYGGLAVGDIDFQQLTESCRSKQGLSGGIARLIFFGSVTLPEGHSNYKSNGNDYPSDVSLEANGKYVYKYLAERQFNELAPADRDAWCAKTIPHVQSVFKFETTHAAWRYVPTICIVLDRDLAIPAQIQERLAGMAGAQVEHLDAGHGAVLSHPKELADKFERLLR